MNLDEVSVVIGIDWADRTHVCCLVGRKEASRQMVQVGASAEAFGAWLDTVEQQYPEGKIVVAVERSEGALVEMLLPRPRMAVVPVNPVVLHRFRQAFAPSGAKDDPGDAALLAEIVLTHAEKFAVLRPAAELLAELSALVRERRHWVDTRTKLVEQLIAVLKKYYPQALETGGETRRQPDDLGVPPTLAGSASRQAGQMEHPGAVLPPASLGPRRAPPAQASPARYRAPGQRERSLCGALPAAPGGDRAPD